ncbi:MAG: prolyl aminopeptidase [Woeseia sp.]|nr:prolyl aminopeptidase [Woeseia sp.]|tara:strand:- start:1439 stop:2404 length:966 start_codon:yes stop_codon:yes gene_type:complete
MSKRDKKRTLYPPIEPNHTGFIDVGSVHKLYYEECGNPDGKPVVFLHGGPGGGCTVSNRRFWDPGVYRIILFDQRGSGRSEPYASLEQNTTWDLVNDIEVLRDTLNIKQWQVFGGSWGSTLALAYAQTYPECVSEIILRGIFLLRQKEIDWVYQHGTSELYPDAWEHYLAPIPEKERHDLVKAYYKRLTSNDLDIQMEAAKAWSIWEGMTSTLLPNDEIAAEFGSTNVALALARIECHYFVNRGFMEENQLIDNVHRIRHIPSVIVQGRYDVLCPVVSAWELLKEWPEADMRIVPDAGHSAFEPGNIHELIMATESFSRQK